MGNADEIKMIAKNKKAFFDYHILDKWEAGIQLTGDEVKAVRNGKVNFKDSYAQAEKGEFFLVGLHISYTKSYGTPMPDRKRKLLLHKAEIRRISSKSQEKGLTIVPLAVYIKKNYIKVEIGTAKGKALYDKRRATKEKELSRNIRREVW